MNRLLTDNVWQQFRQANRGYKGHKVAALAYVSTASLLGFRQGDLLICDASDRAIKSGETSASVLSQFHRAGAEIYSCPDLHAKVVVFGRSVLIGSCNLSQSSAENLRELAVVVSDSSTRSQAIAFIHKLAETASPVDSSFLKRIARIPVTRRRRAHRKRHSIQLGNRTWVIRTHKLDPDRYKAEFPLVKEAEQEVRGKLRKPRADIGWVRWAGKSKFRSLAREGDTIIEMNSLRRGKQITVSAPAVHPDGTGKKIE
jgi:phosphatidylserine/phosphatidylglycerophosphate/cardiolipin synthase-like enzyme